MSTTPTTRRRCRPVVGFAAAIVGLAILIFGLHGQSLGDGLFMDDHAHFRQLREADWSLSALADACRLELVGGLVELWWLPDITLRFFRPVAFGLMKLTYTASDWSPAALHLASLLWHLAACTLLMVLLRRMGASAWLAWGTAGLFAIHPGQVATVQWIACQTELMVTTFLLAATLCFARFRGWPGFTGEVPTAPLPSREGPGEGQTRASNECSPRTLPAQQGNITATPAAGWAIASVLFFVLALGCRENAAMFPFVMAAVEPLVWRRRRKPALVLYGVLLLVLAAYGITRTVVLGGVELPPRPYVMPLSAPGFWRFVFDKAWYYLLGEYLLLPCVPIGGLPYFQARPLVFYGLASLTAVLLGAICFRYWRRRPGLIGPAWLIGFFLPVLPVFAAPHHLYLPGIGWAVTAMLVLRGIGSAGPVATAWRVRRRRAAMWGSVLLLGGLFGVMTFYCGLAVETGQRVEDCVAEEIAAAPSGLRDGDTLYVANLPLLGHYARLAIEERTGLRDLRVIPLTWSPRLLGPATPTELNWIDDRTIEVRVAQDRYFAGPLRLLVREATGRDIPDEVDRLGDLGLRVRVVERDEKGIAALRFEFARPLSDPRTHLFWGSRTRWAYELRP